MTPPHARESNTTRAPWRKPPIASRCPSTEARVQERYTRVDQYNIQLTATIDDPKIYTKSWRVIKANYYWMKNQDFDETFCVPSDAIEYLKVISPSGNEGGVK